MTDTAYLISRLKEIRGYDNFDRTVAADAIKEIERLSAEGRDLRETLERFRSAYQERWVGDVDIRLDNREELDEIVGKGVGVHIEALGNGKWFANVGACRFNIYGALFPMEVDEWCEEAVRVSTQQKSTSAGDSIQPDNADTLTETETGAHGSAQSGQCEHPSHTYQKQCFYSCPECGEKFSERA